jgi:hypothetical protein
MAMPIQESDPTAGLRSIGDRLAEKREAAMLGGGEKRIEAQHKKGKTQKNKKM